MVLTSYGVGYFCCVSIAPSSFTAASRVRVRLVFLWRVNANSFISRRIGGYVVQKITQFT